MECSKCGEPILSVCYHVTADAYYRDPEYVSDGHKSQWICPRAKEKHTLCVSCWAKVKKVLEEG